jgi:hypothetical protein
MAIEGWASLKFYFENVQQKRCLFSIFLSNANHFRQAVAIYEWVYYISVSRNFCITKLYLGGLIFLWGQDFFFGGYKQLFCCLHNLQRPLGTYHIILELLHTRAGTKMYSQSLVFMEKIKAWGLSSKFDTTARCAKNIPPKQKLFLHRR